MPRTRDDADRPEDDVEGHAFTIGAAPDADDDEDDVQGHMVPGKTIPKVMPDDELSDHLPR